MATQNSGRGHLPGGVDGGKHNVRVPGVELAIEVLHRRADYTAKEHDSGHARAAVLVRRGGVGPSGSPPLPFRKRQSNAVQDAIKASNKLNATTIPHSRG